MGSEGSTLKIQPMQNYDDAIATTGFSETWVYLNGPFAGKKECNMKPLISASYT